MNPICDVYSFDNEQQFKTPTNSPRLLGFSTLGAIVAYQTVVLKVYRIGLR
jgi:hypothetical protein